MENLQPNQSSDALSGGTSLGVLRRVDKLRAYIKARSAELNIQPEHDKTGHYYRFGDQKYKSVTYHLSLLKDPSIALWQKNRALEHLWNNAGQIAIAFTEKNMDRVEQLWEDAKQAPILEFEGAGSIGKQVHDWREKWFSGWIDNGTSTIPISDLLNAEGAVLSCHRALRKFIIDSGYIPLATELYVADSKLGIGGTLDDIGLLPRFHEGNLTVFDLVLIDLKTSNIGDKEQYYAQVCLYLSMFKKLYKLHPKGVYILHLSKENGTYELIPLHDRCNISKTTKWAKQVVQVSQGLEELKESKKIKPIII